MNTLQRCEDSQNINTLVQASTGWAKKNPKCSTHNFVKYALILKILSPLQSPEKLQCSGH